jgi:hypothetical protein
MGVIHESKAASRSIWVSPDLNGRVCTVVGCCVYNQEQKIEKGEKKGKVVTELNIKCT